MRVRAFQGLRPKPETAPQVASLPYDVVTTEEARALAAGNPASFLRVVRAEIDLPEGTDPYSDAVYATARANLDRLIETGALVRETEPCLYVYELIMDGQRQRGITAICHIDDYENDIIKKHEKTRPQKENDRLRLNKELEAHPGPVFLTYRDHPTLAELMDEVCRQEPFAAFTADDGVAHTVWRIPGGSSLVEAFAEVPVAYVADGHHRSASAARVGRERREANPGHTGEEDYNWFLAVLFPASELVILPYNRIVLDLNGRSPTAFLEQLSHCGTLITDAPATPTQPGHVSIYIDNTWYGLAFAPKALADPASGLDVARLQDEVLQPLLGIDDPRTSPQIDFIGGIRGTGYLEDMVNHGRAAVAFSLFPTTVDDLMAIADAGQIMPPKSTWFEPKLRSGLFVHTF